MNGMKTKDGKVTNGVGGKSEGERYSCKNGELRVKMGIVEDEEERIKERCGR